MTNHGAFDCALTVLSALRLEDDSPWGEVATHYQLEDAARSSIPHPKPRTRF